MSDFSVHNNPPINSCKLLDALPHASVLISSQEQMVWTNDRFNALFLGGESGTGQLLQAALPELAARVRELLAQAAGAEHRVAEGFLPPYHLKLARVDEDNEESIFLLQIIPALEATQTEEPITSSTERDPLEILKLLNSTLPLQDLLAQVLTRLSWQLGAAGGVIYQFDVNRQINTVLAAVGIPETFRRSGEFPLGETDSQHSLLAGKPYWKSNIQADLQEGRLNLSDLPASLQFIVERMPNKIQAVLSVPLFVKEAIFGAIQLFYVEPHDASRKEINLALRYANFAALAIENHRLYDETEQRTQELSALYRADAYLYRHLDLQEVMQALVDVAVDILQADKSSLLVWNPNLERLELSAAHGFKEETLRKMNLRPDEGLVGTVALTGEVAVVLDARKDPRVNQEITEAEGIRSFIHVPIIVSGEVFGVFNIDYLEPRSFDENERRLFTALAQRASLAIENANLYQAEHDRNKQLQTLLDVTDWMSSSLDLETVLERVSSSLVQAVDGERCWIYFPLFGESQLRLVYHNINGEPTVPQGQSAGAAKLLDPEEISFVQEALKKGIPVYSPEQIPDLTRINFFDQTEGTAFLAIPCTSGDHLEALVLLSFREEKRVDLMDRENLVAAIANAAALSLENARYYQEAKQHGEEIRILFNIQQAVSRHLEPWAVLQMIADHAQRLSNGDSAFVGLIEGNQVNVAVLAGQSSPVRRGQQIPLENRLLGPAILSGKTQKFSWENEEQANWLSEAGLDKTQSCLLAPMVSLSKPLGIICVSARRKNAFAPKVERLLALLASSAAVALENARLYQAQQDRRMVAEGLRAVLSALNRNQSLEATLSLIASQAARFLKAESVAIYGYDAKEKIIKILSGFNLPSELEHLEWIPAYSGGAVQAMFQKSPYVVEDIPAQITTAEQNGGDISAERLQKWLQILSENYRSYLGIPLIVEDQVYGTLGIYYKDSHRTAEEEMGLAHSLGEQAALAVETARLREQIRQAAVAEERSRLARELHDAVTQTLFSASLIAEVLPRLWERDEEEAQKRLQELRLLTRSALAEMRTLLLELRPSALTEAKLSDLIQHLSDAFSGRSRVPVSLELDLSEELPLDLKVAVYRILQEALHNISKHAKAEKVLITAVQRADSFELIVQDNGIGFDPHKIPSDHLGLGIMRERAVQIGAQFQIDSAPNKGTRIKLTWRAPEE